jgi:hypothetical protein
MGGGKHGPAVWLGFALVVAVCAMALRPGAGRSATAGAVMDPDLDRIELPKADRRPLSDYSPAFGDLFGKTPALQEVKAAPPALPRAQPPAAPAPPPDPLEGLVFAGLVTIDGRSYALVEDRATRQGEYLAPGDDFKGFNISAIDRNGVTLTNGDVPRRLALNDRYSLVPLSKEAGVASAAGSVQPVSQRLYANSLADTFMVKTLLVLGNRREEVEKANDEFFQGKITQEELDRRTTAGDSAWGSSILTFKGPGTVTFQDDLRAWTGIGLTR